MFLHMSVILSTGGACVAGAHVWQRGLCGKGSMHWQLGHTWQRGVNGRGHVWQGVCQRIT